MRFSLSDLPDPLTPTPSSHVPVMVASPSTVVPIVIQDQEREAASAATTTAPTTMTTTTTTTTTSPPSSFATDGAHDVAAMEAAMTD